MPKRPNVTKLLKESLKQLQLINGSRDRCVFGPTDFCPNHTLIENLTTYLNLSDNIKAHLRKK